MTFSVCNLLISRHLNFRGLITLSKQKSPARELTKPPLVPSTTDSTQAMAIYFLMGEYMGKTRDSAAILAEVSPYINKEDSKHIKGIINQGCLSHLHFEEEYENKHLAL
jgi:hypothetical protein